MLVDCKRCKGEGIIIVEKKEWDGMAINPLIVLCTLGLSLSDGKRIIEKEKTCDCCGGIGRLKVKEI